MEPALARDVAVEVARTAAALLSEGWGHAGTLRSKTLDKDLVTEWDTRVEERIVAEEGGERGDAASADRWLVDPLDGTVNFAHGLPVFAVSIGYARGARIDAGAVIAPVLGWEFAAARGAGATCNGKPIHVSPTGSLARSLLATGFPYDRAVSAPNNFAEFVHLQRVAGAVRRLGAASLDLCFVARGWLDGYWEFKVKPWDVAAGAIIVEEAGGRVSAIGGGPFDADQGEVVATNGAIHEALVAALAAAPAL